MFSTRWLLRGGVLGPVLFVAAFVVIGALRHDYDATRQFVSLLSLTPDGWQQIVNFLVAGTLICGGAVGLRRIMTTGLGSTWAPVLIGVGGLCILVAGVFVTDPAQGYPPGTPPGPPATLSTSGTIHGIASSLFFFGALPLAAFLLGRRFHHDDRRLAIYCVLSGVGTVAFPLAAFALSDAAGTLQRIAIVIAYGFIARVMWRYAPGTSRGQRAAGQPGAVTF